VSDLPALARTRLRKTYRIVRSIYPPIDLFEDIADPKDWELLAAAEAKTNPRVRDQIGAIHLVPPQRRVSGPGASWVMAAFTHISPLCARRASATATTASLRGRSFRGRQPARPCSTSSASCVRTNEEPASADSRELVDRSTRSLHDLRTDARFAACLDPDPARYPVAQSLARSLRNEHGSNGIVYPSVRHAKGVAIAAFWPDVVGIPVQGRHLCYRWNGERADAWFVYGEEAWIALPPS
jgi:hypothetical protein